MKAMPARHWLHGKVGLIGTSAYRPEQQPETPVERPIASPADPHHRLPLPPALHDPTSSIRLKRSAHTSLTS